MDPNPWQELPPPSHEVLGRLVYGLYFLSAGTPDQPAGLLVSWVSQVSGQPPLVMAALRHNRALAPRLGPGQAFCLNLLPAGERDLLGRLARPAGERWRGLELLEGPLGLPVLAEALGGLACRVREVQRPGDHLLLVAEVMGALWRGGAPVMGALQGGHPYLGLR